MHEHKGTGGGLVESMRQAISEFAPEYLHVQHDARKQEAAARNRQEKAPRGHHSAPAGNFTDHEKRRALEHLMGQQLHFSHKPFLTGNPPAEKRFQGGWEGTFAGKHGGFQHMFEELVPSKSTVWLGKTSMKPVQALPVLVPYTSPTARILYAGWSDLDLRRSRS